jgi:hypothetical protein
LPTHFFPKNFPPQFSAPPSHCERRDLSPSSLQISHPLVRRQMVDAEHRTNQVYDSPYTAEPTSTTKCRTTHHHDDRRTTPSCGSKSWTESTPGLRKAPSRTSHPNSFPPPSPTKQSRPPPSRVAAAAASASAHRSIFLLILCFFWGGSLIWVLVLDFGCVFNRPFFLDTHKIYSSL